jgi:hypothetical protein
MTMQPHKYAVPKNRYGKKTGVWHLVYLSSDWHFALFKIISYIVTNISE